MPARIPEVEDRVSLAAKDGSPSSTFNNTVLVSVYFLQNTNGNVNKPLGRWRILNRLGQVLGSWKRPDLRTWPAYHGSSPQMLCQTVAHQAAEPLGTTATSWQYHTGEMECSRRHIRID
jgi:hypothetical protein